MDGGIKLAKGDKWEHNFKRYNDSVTGRLVTKLTTGDHLCHHPYFYNKAITNDNSFLIFASNKDGQRELYKMDLHNGEAEQLTEGKEINDFSAMLTNDDRYLIFSRGNKIIRMDLKTLNEDAVYETPSGWLTGGNPGISSDNGYLVLVEMDEKDRITSKGDWSNFEPQWAKKPCCRIVYINIEKKTSKVVHQEEHCWLGHPQISPSDNGTILFCHEGPGNRIDARLWMLNADGTDVRCLKPQGHHELITHEYWLNDGSRLAFIYRNSEKNEETIRFLNPDTMDEEILMDCSTYCHFISNHNNTRIIGDGQNPKKPFIYLIDVIRKKEEKLCMHGSRWKSYGNNQDAHPHPAFSPDGSFIIFTSDMDGIPGIYRVDLE